MIQTNSIFDKINFNGGNLSSDGGSILLSQFLEKMNLRKVPKKQWTFMKQEETAKTLQKN